MGMKPRVAAAARDLDREISRAVEKDNLEAVIEVLDAGADVQLRDYKQGSLLVRARSGPMVKLLTDRGVAVNDCDENRWTALHYAVHRGNLEVVRALLDAGADPSHTDKENNRPAEMASRHELRELLGPVNERDFVFSGLGDLRLEAPLASGKLDEVRALLDGGAELEAYPGASEWLAREAGDRGRTDILKLMVERGLPIGDHRALTNAVDQDRLEAADYLLVHGAGPGCQTWKSSGLFSLAKSASMGRLLIKRGVAATSVDDSGKTPLHYAAKYGDPELVELLLASGADKDIADRFGFTPARLAPSARVRALLETS